MTENNVHVWPKEINDHWLTQSDHWVTVSPKQFELSVGYSLLPRQLQVHTPPPSGLLHLQA